jgi:galactose mutarotase-like enzyme
MAEMIETGAALENVVIQSGDCAVTFLPQLGGKIASILVHGRELLQTPLAPYGPRTQTMPFDESDASGWDECLPSVDPCTVETAAGQAFVPDHGDLWRVPWELVNSSSMCATFRAQCFSLPLELERATALVQIEKGWCLRLDYQVTNTGAYPAPWSWTAHPSFAAEAGDRVVLPESVHDLRLAYSGEGRLGQTNDKVQWPMAALALGGETDLGLAQAPETAIAEKLFAGPLAVCEDWCALERPKAGLRIRFRFSPAATPFLGMWLCYGGWPGRPGPKQSCVTLEPSTTAFDSLAQTGPWSRVLAPGQSFSWPMIVEIESI